MASIYGLSKGGILSFTRATALEFKKLGYDVRCNCVCPGLVRTDMAQSVQARVMRSGLSPNEANASLCALYPVGRLGEAEEIARGILFLASDESSFMTGAQLVLDGGYTAQ